jgi:hypothetical protein
MSRPLTVHSLFRAVVSDTGTPHYASQHRTSLLFMWEQTHKEGFSPRWTCTVAFFFVLFVHSFFPVFRGTPIHPSDKSDGILSPSTPRYKKLQHATAKNTN